ncbi:dephospho-CoA kinase [Oceanibacterium hippocampi]|uniref:Dephospho-CoA kinase n=1 Tax=Oceanibacterium hippocampi TaxID=745714 RepID=A0A1Y5RMJ4_9PROT|nr:dephospho-CoA kinase [Oceanibacterium hippocampi]SLN20959.1 Dephospho-CoA kinase [Oceanibacterium hippocampi]
MKTIGLTGSIGMGKSTVAGMFRALGVPTYDSDAAVHAIYARGGTAVGPIGAAFPGTIRDGAVDRAALSACVIGKPEELARLEKIIHPLLSEGRKAFLRDAEASGKALALLDIPLLFETGGEARVDIVVVVSAPADIQRERVMKRPGMTAEKLDAILARQTPDAEKRARADWVIETGGSLDDTLNQVTSLVRRLTGADDQRQES